MNDMFHFEEEVQTLGFELIAGVDEVGRGSMIGPVITAAVILNPKNKIEGLNDSKQLTAKKRQLLEIEIKEKAIAWAIGEATVEEVDTLNVYQATKVAMQRAIERLTIHPDYLLIDAMPLESEIPRQSIIKGDSKSASIAAASIIAKEYRDRLIIEEAERYPEYQFEKNKGYLTKVHREALEKLGPTPYHRKTFKPVKEMLETSVFENVTLFSKDKS